MGHLDLDSYLEKLKQPTKLRINRGRYIVERKGDCTEGSIFIIKGNKKIGSLMYSTVSIIGGEETTPSTMSIDDVWVAKDYRNRKFGTLLYAELCTFIRKECPLIEEVVGQVTSNYAFKARNRIFGEPSRVTDFIGGPYVRSKVSGCKEIIGAWR